MELVRRMLATVQRQLSALTLTQRLLIAALAMILLMGFFLVSQYAGAPKYVPLAPSATAEEQQKMAESLDVVGVRYVTENGKLQVPAEQWHMAMARLAQAQALPGDRRLMFEQLIGQQNWLMSSSQINAMNIIALSNELAAVIKNFPGIDNASVFISSPEPRGIGAPFRRPVAQVTVFPRRGSGLDQATVNALADLVAGSTSGMEARDVAIIDGTNKRSYRAVAGDEMTSGTYMEHVGKVETRVREKVEDQLKFIAGVIVSVNAMVDASRRSSKEIRVLDRNAGTVVVPVEESGTNSTTAAARPKAAAPGLDSNVAMDIATANSGGGGNSSSDETTTTKSEVRFGERVTTQSDPTGRPTKINVTVSVPREYVVELVKRRKAGGQGGAAGAADAEPTDDELKQEWEGAGGEGQSAGGLRAKIEEMVAPLVETDSSSGLSAAATPTITPGTVRAFLIPVATASIMPAGSGGAAGAGSGGVTGLLTGLTSGGGGIIKYALLGGLAALAVGLMLTVARKSTQASALPTAEEIVGIPPTLSNAGDIVGEADEGETPMTGIEVDADALKSSRMLEEISQLVKSNPTSAATVFNRWLSTDA